MKVLTLILFALLTAAQANAQSFAASSDYGFIIKPTESKDACLAQIRAISSASGGSEVRYLEQIEVGTVTLTSDGAKLVSQLACITTFEVMGIAHADPAVGRSN